MSETLEQRAERARLLREEAQRKAESERSAFKSALHATLEEARASLDAAGVDDRLRAEAELQRRKDEAEHAQQWRLNIAKYAPVAKWRAAWNPKRTEALDLMREWMRGDHGDRHLGLCGPKGIGKTIAAVSWVKSLVEPGKFRGNPVVWLRPDDLVSAVCHSYDPDSPRLARNIVLDEMGEERREDFVHAMRKLLDKDGHRILITSNLTREQMRSRYGHDVAFCDRLEHVAQCFYLGGESLRSNDGGFF